LTNENQKETQTLKRRRFNHKGNGMQRIYTLDLTFPSVYGSRINLTTNNLQIVGCSAPEICKSNSLLKSSAPSTLKDSTSVNQEANFHFKIKYKHSQWTHYQERLSISVTLLLSCPPFPHKESIPQYFEEQSPSSHW
jgi:hypothetical protein